MRICIDLDETLCQGSPYSIARPIPGALEFLQWLRSQGHVIILYTARGMRTYTGNLGKINANIANLTFLQLDQWRFPYDEIYFGKPEADLYIDDKALRIVNYEQLREDIQEACYGSISAALGSINQN